MRKGPAVESGDARSSGLRLRSAAAREGEIPGAAALLARRAQLAERCRQHAERQRETGDVEAPTST